MKRERLADRWLDGIVVALVVLVLAFAATAPRASPEAVSVGVATVPMPTTGCEQVAVRVRSWLLAAQASALR